MPQNPCHSELNLPLSPFSYKEVIERKKLKGTPTINVDYGIYVLLCNRVTILLSYSVDVFFLEVNDTLIFCG